MLQSVEVKKSSTNQAVLAEAPADATNLEPTSIAQPSAQTSTTSVQTANPELDRISPAKFWPFLTMHLAVGLVYWAGFSWTALAVAVFTYYARVFGITGGYHRYFSHRTYKTSRVFQFCMAWLGCAAAQMGPLWWAAHHRDHHRYSDTDKDLHSPGIRGFFYAHMGWIMVPRNLETNMKNIKDFAKFPELVFLNKHFYLPPASLAFAMFGLGWLLEKVAPGLGTNAFQMVVWGFVISTVALYHGTFCINSFCHIIGSRRFNTKDESRNSLLLAIITAGEGWHNNHHRYPYSEQQGIYWWEIDMSHYLIKLFEKLGLVWDVNKPPKELYEEAEGKLSPRSPKAAEA